MRGEIYAQRCAWSRREQPRESRGKFRLRQRTDGSRGTARERGEGVWSNLSASPAWSGSSPRMRGRSGLKASISGFWTAHPRKGRGLDTVLSKRDLCIRFIPISTYISGSRLRGHFEACLYKDSFMFFIARAKSNSLTRYLSPIDSAISTAEEITLFFHSVQSFFETQA